MRPSPQPSSGHIHHRQGSLMALCHAFFHTPQPPLIYHYRCLLFLKFYTDGRYSTYSIPCNIIILRCFHIVYQQLIHFYCWVVAVVWIYHDLFLHSFVDLCLNTAAVNIHMQIFVWTVVPPLDKCLGVEWLACMVGMNLLKKKTTQLYCGVIYTQNSLILSVN